MQRACAAALIKGGETIINNAGKSNDDLAALDVIQKLSSAVTSLDDHKLLIKGNDFSSISTEINCGESGLGLRMFAPIAALSSGEIVLNGAGSLLKRPMDFFDEIFPQLNISIHSNNGKLPVKIKGPLQPKNISIDGSLSSQFLTGLLMAYAKACKEPVTIKVTNLKSKPYIDLTLQVLGHFGWYVKHNNYEEFYFDPKVFANREDLERTAYTVEGDWSGAAFLLVGGAVAGDIIVEGLSVQSTQADKAILDALKKSEVSMSINTSEILIKRSELKAFDFDATDCPDLFPPLVTLASYCKGTTSISGVNRLTHKESNRALSLQSEFKKMGINISLQNDVMLIEGGRPVGAVVHSHHDHRIAMACAVAALQADGETIIHDADAINKSYPDFYAHLKRLNASLQIA
jgi:3-phosphoshikimate 1-carboxyvinyltransferase